MSWSIHLANQPSREELKANLEAEPAVRDGHMPVQVHALCLDAVDLIPSFGDTPDHPATGYNLRSFGHVVPEGGQSTSNFTIEVSNNFVTSGN